MAVKREAKFTLLFRSWIRANSRLFGSAAFELKQTTTDAIPFTAVEPHQLDALCAAKKNEILYKAPDDSRGVKPFDLFFLKHAESYVVIKYPDAFVLIDVETFIHEAMVSERKSLTFKRAWAIAKHKVRL